MTVQALLYLLRVQIYRLQMAPARSSNIFSYLRKLLGEPLRKRYVVLPDLDDTTEVDRFVLDLYWKGHEREGVRFV